MKIHVVTEVTEGIPCGQHLFTSLEEAEKRFIMLANENVGSLTPMEQDEILEEGWHASTDGGYAVSISSDVEVE